MVLKSSTGIIVNSSKPLVDCIWMVRMSSFVIKHWRNTFKGNGQVLRTTTINVCLGACIILYYIIMNIYKS